MTGKRLLVFAKAPVAGQVKTRLVPALGAQGAAALHAELVERTLARLDGFREDTELWCAPDAAEAYFRGLGTRFGVGLQSQRGDDLGERMHHALCDALGRAGKAVLVGTDAPALGHALVAGAFAVLDTCPAVFVPAEDGGYALVGLRQPMPSLFRAMPWGSDAVMARTRERLIAAGIAWHELPMTWDIDRPEDLERYRAVLAQEKQRSAP